MSYSSMAESDAKAAVFSSYEHIDFILRTRSMVSDCLYLCVISPEKDHSVKSADLPGLVEVVDVGGRSDFIIESSPDDIGRIAARLHEQTGLPVGVARYDRQQAPGLMQSNALLAERRAANSKDGFYIFEEGKDSVTARLSRLQG